MRKEIWVGIGLFILLFGILFVLNNPTPTGQVIENQTIDGEEPPVPAKEVETPKVGELTPITHEVNIVNFAFSPTEIKIKVGDTVVWQNKDKVAHTVTSDDGIEMNSRFLNEGERYSHTFNTIGEFSYFCKPHPYMRGKIIVD